MLFTIIVFIILLGILVFVHELGHFVTARRLGVKAEEFGFGFPPRIFGVQLTKTVETEPVETVKTEIIDVKTDNAEIISASSEQSVEVRPVEQKKWRFIWGSRDIKELTNGESRDWGTIYSLNWIPLGGFVKIKG